MTTILIKNLKSLASVDQALAVALQNAIAFASAVHTCPDGGVSLRTQGDEGKWVQSRRAPVTEAERLLEQVTLRLKETLVVVGVAGGALAQIALNKYPKSRVIVIEENLALLRTVLEVIDFSDAIATRHLVFFVEVPHRHANEIMRPIGWDFALYGHQILHHGYTKGEDAYGTALQALSRSVSKLGIAMQGEFGGHATYAGNGLANCVHYLSSPPLTPFTGIMAGKTAVLCGAGPSLSKQLATLKAHQEQVFIFSVSSALKRVLGAGIRVDATAVVDYSHLSARYFRGLPEYPPLWAEANAHPMVLDNYKGPKLLNDRIELDMLFDGEIAPRGGETGDSTNVSHFSFHILALLGFSRIILIGMDQAATNHITHAPGAPMYDEIAAGASRFSTLEGQELIAVSCGIDRNYAGEDVNGVQLVTDRQMFESAHTFEALFAQHQDIEMINSTEGGRRLRGAADVPFAAALASLSKEPIDLAVYADLVNRPAAEARKDLSKGHAKLEAKRRWGRSVDLALRDLESAYRRAAERFAAGQSASVSKETDKIERVVGDQKNLYQQLSRYASADNFERLRAQRDAEEAATSAVDLQAALALIEADYISALRRGIQRWFASLARGLQRVKASIEGLPLESEAPTEDALSGSSDGRPRVIDAYIELSDDEECRLAFIGDGAYSPLQVAINSLRQHQTLRRIIINTEREALPAWIDAEGVQCVQASQAQDLPRRGDARRLMAWNAVSTLRGVNMATVLSTSANPYRILEDLGEAETAPDFVLVISDQTGILTPEVVGFLIDSGRETHWEQAMYLAEGPQGLFPVLWETDSLLQCVKDGTATQVVFLHTGSFWGKSFAHMPTEVIQVRRNFALNTPRGRDMTKAVVKKLQSEQKAISLENVRTAAESAWQTWVGDTPIDVELEITSARAFHPTWLPKPTRDAEMPMAVIEKTAAELGGFAQGAMLTLGGLGDPMLHPEVFEIIAKLRPQVQALQVRTFGASLEQLSKLRDLGVDAITVRFGAWGPEGYREMNGVDRFSDVAEPLILFAKEQLETGRQLPMIVPEVVKTLEADRTLIAFRDAWWTVASFPLVNSFNTFGGVLADRSTIVLHPGKRKPCMRTQEQMVIFADGSVPLCWQDFDAAAPLGNVAEMSIRELWQHPRLLALRESHVAGQWDAENAACANCNEWYRFN